MLDRLAAELAALRAADQLRELAISEGIQLNSNDYLGLSTHPRLKDAIRRALEEDERAASTGSRLLSGNHARWEELESEFAGHVGAEAALYFPSGYAANIGLLSSVLKPEDTVFSDSANHASIIDGVRLSRARKVIFPHLDLNFLENALRQTSGNKVVVTETLFSMEGDHAPLEEISVLCTQFGASLILDAAHSFGLDIPRLSKAGRFVQENAPVATVYPCGKALASFGAFVAGTRTLCDFLINRARPFIFSTALPPYCAAHVREALVLVSEANDQRAHLKTLAAHFRSNLRAAGFNIGRSDSQIVPLILGSNETAIRFASALSAEGFAVRAIRPPTVPAGTARLRLSLNATLSIADLDALTGALGRINETEAVRE